MIGLGTLDGYTLSNAQSVSDDGSTVVGYCQGPLSYRAFRWSATAGMVDLGTYSTDARYTGAWSTNHDGTAIVGFAYIAMRPPQTFLWSVQSGMGHLPNSGLCNCGCDPQRRCQYDCWHVYGCW
ncbi:MAG: hypothetical protein ACREJO_15400 [Phycisphaerales bacterium]